MLLTIEENKSYIRMLLINKPRVRLGVTLRGSEYRRADNEEDETESFLVRA
jgi:hypothetical protein